MKFSVLPESSERWTTVIAVDGSSTPSFCSAISSSSHGDLAGEYLGDGVGLHVEAIDTFQVEGDCYRGDGRNVERISCTARLFLFFSIHCGVGTSGVYWPAMKPSRRNRSQLGRS